MTRQEEIADLKRRIEALENEGKQWEPEPGDWFVDASGEVELLASEYDSMVFGTERKTKQQAEKARDKMRVFNRLLAYHNEFCPYFEFETELFIYIMLPHSAAVELCRKINSGVVVL